MSDMNYQSHSERFTLTTAGLCRAVAASIARGVMNAAMIVLVWGRVKRAEVAFLALIERVRSGRYRGGWVRKGAAAGGGVREARAPVVLERGRLPLRFGWLMGMIPGEAACFGSQLRTVLAEPEMAALVRDVAQARRILGPVCRMLGVEIARVRPLPPVKVADAAVATLGEGPARVRNGRVRKVLDFGRIPLPRGVLAAARRQGFGKYS